jgi:hypothetical protein
MSHFAEIDENNKVIRVLVGNPELSDADGLIEISQLLGGTWLQTSYNSTIRGNYAGAGFSYLEEFDLFMPPRCHDEAILNDETAKWDCANSDHHVDYSG